MMVETSLNSSLELASSSKKRSMDEQSTRGWKRARLDKLFKLESESSSFTSEEDTESHLSLQSYTTELVRYTSEADTRSEFSDSDVDVQVEYEVDDRSGDEENPFLDLGSSSGTEGVIAAAGAIAAAICDSSLGSWLTDGEESDNSSVGVELHHTDFETCMQCLSKNDNPRFRYCHKCYQMRKKIFPPRPRGHRKRQNKNNKRSIQVSVQSKTPKRSKDSGISSQELGGVLEEPAKSSQDSGIGLEEIPTFEINFTSTSKEIGNARGVKRKSSLEIEDEAVIGDSSKRIKVEGDEDEPIGSNAKKKSEEVHQNEMHMFVKSESVNGDGAKEVEFAKPASVDMPRKDHQEPMCIMCENEPQNSVFLHDKMGCMSCCYKCAKRSWSTYKKCPNCTRKVSNIIRIYKS